ncbi:MAG: DUF433 domain-containing protein [Caldiserica bacterium]|nr:MAG: DUF433 domain-containing protein [Caldisericota bacterium]
MKNNLLNRITVNPKICHGKPVIKGTRIMVWQILDLLENGCGFDEIIKDYFPQITKEDIKACIHYANSIVKNEEIIFPKELKHAFSR